MADVDNDLVKTDGRVRKAGGEVILLKGTIRTRDGTPLAGHRIEIWQCDMNGKYLHPGGGRPIVHDEGFQEFGHDITDADGNYRFRTIKPTPYPGRHCLSIGINWGLPEGTPGYSHEAFHGPKGGAYTDDAYNRDVNLGEPSATKTVVVKTGQGVRTIACQGDHEGPEVCVGKTVAAIRDDASPRLNGGGGYDVLRLILAALESIESGQTVYLEAAR